MFLKLFFYRLDRSHISGICSAVRLFNGVNNSIETAYYDLRLLIMFTMYCRGPLTTTTSRCTFPSFEYATTANETNHNAV